MTRVKKQIVLVALLLGALFLGSSCGGPKIIPDEKLARIFHDVYLTNAYADLDRIELDSLNIYEPVFARYGYTSEDIQFTIGSFSKRKSARLSSDVVSKAIEMLASESRLYSHRIAMADTVARIARDRSASVVYFDTLIRVGRIADTSRLRIAVPVEPGSYLVEYGYFIDSTDLNEISRTNIYLADERGVRSGASNRRPVRAERGEFSQTFTAEDGHLSLVLDLNAYPTKNMTIPNMRIDSLVITRYLPDSVALEAMQRELFEWRKLDSLSNRNETPFIPPLVDTAGVAPE